MAVTFGDLIDVEEALKAKSIPFRISEKRGPLGIVLNGRTLPQRGKNGSGGGVAFGSSLRVSVKYYPGNPVAESQVLGLKWEDTELSGRWTDAHMGGRNAAQLFGFSELQANPAAANAGAMMSFTNEATRAHQLRDAFWVLQKRGQLLKVSWGLVARYGFLREFIPTHSTNNDISWTMKFEWVSDADGYPDIVAPDELSAPSLLEQIQAALDAFNALLDRLLLQIYGTIDVLNAKLVKFTQSVVKVVESLTQFAELALVPGDLAKLVKQQVSSVLVALQDLLATITSIPAAYTPRKEGANQDQINATEEAIAAIIEAAKALGLDMAEIALRLSKIEDSDLLAVVVTRAGQTLMDLAREHYGDPTSWPLIADYNNVVSAVQPSGTVLRVPKKGK